MELDFNKYIYHGWSGSWLDGTKSRIAIKKEKFIEIGGYDETMVGEYHDIDLLDRIKHYYKDELVISYRNNINTLSIMNNNTKYNLENRKKSKIKIKNKDFIKKNNLDVKVTRILPSNINSYFL